MRAVFLDRDGVLNSVVFRDGKPASPRSLDEFVLKPGAAEAVDRLRDGGFLVFVVTNQPDVARGRLSEEALDAMMSRLRTAVRVHDVRVCPHDDHHDCVCRKPRPGMLEELARAHGVALASSFIVGDSWKDVEAGQAAGCEPVLLRRDYNTDVDVRLEAQDLDAAVDLILEMTETDA